MEEAGERCMGKEGGEGEWGRRKGNGGGGGSGGKGTLEIKDDFAGEFEKVILNHFEHRLKLRVRLVSSKGCCENHLTGILLI